MNKGLVEAVRRRAGDRCEYCRMPGAASRLKHVADHIIARQHHGPTTLDNLALCCARCNEFKGPNLAGIDPATTQLTRLYHPRRDRWAEHFRWENAILVGVTDVGRTTVDVLAINDTLRVAAREILLEDG